MAGFLAFKERDSECLGCICILVCSILFIVISYERVDDHGEFQQKLEEEDGKKETTNLDSQILKWR
jgi:Fe-S-cluster-containing hydrogenase component 2